MRLDAREDDRLVKIGRERGTLPTEFPTFPSNEKGSRGTSHENAGKQSDREGRGGDEEESVEQVARTNRYVGGNEYFTINFARFHCSNCEHFRPAGAKPQGVTINYDGVMPQSIYYAAHRMPPQMIPTCLHARALCRRPSASLRFRCVTG